VPDADRYDRPQATQYALPDAIPYDDRYADKYALA
jgi:hypothetical protein